MSAIVRARSSSNIEQEAQSHGSLCGGHGIARPCWLVNALSSILGGVSGYLTITKRQNPFRGSRLAAPLGHDGGRSSAKVKSESSMSCVVTQIRGKIKANKWFGPRTLPAITTCYGGYPPAALGNCFTLLLVGFLSTWPTGQPVSRFPGVEVEVAAVQHGRAGTHVFCQLLRVAVLMNLSRGITVTAAVDATVAS